MKATKRAAVSRLPTRVRSIPIPPETAVEPGETLAEAESEIGVNDWIDPETGEPAEGESPPRLDEE